MPVQLTFDPAKSQKLSKVLAVPHAWTLWLLWKPRHLTNQYFDDECIDIGEAIAQLKPQSQSELERCFGTGLHHFGSNFMSGDVVKFCREALPFFTGEKAVETVVNSD